MSTTAAVVLAAGAGSRFGGDVHKLLAEVGGRRLVDHALTAVLYADIGPVYVVTGAADLDLPDDLTVVPNPRWAEGIATSLRAGLAAAGADGHAAAVVGLADQPGVTAEAWRLVAAATATPLAVATYDGEWANPVRLAAEMWPLVPDAGDEGARTLLHRRRELVTEVPCPGSPDDVDTLEDLGRWS